MRRRPLFVVIVGSGEFAQKALDGVRGLVKARGGQVRLVVRRRDEALFNSLAPVVEAGANYANLPAWLEGLRGDGVAVHHRFDDQIGIIEYELTEAAQRGDRVAAYVVTSAEDHFAFTRFLAAAHCDVLVEKPPSNVAADLRLFDALPSAQHERIRVADHLLFRPGIEQGLLRERKFIQKHLKKKGRTATYRFVFVEEVGRDDPAKRTSAYRDGAILDMLACHGLAPLAQLILRGLRGVDLARLDEYLVIDRIGAWRATRAGRLAVPVFAETAARIVGRVVVKGRVLIHFDLRSAKECAGFDRRIEVDLSGGAGRYRVSLGAQGATVATRKGRQTKLHQRGVSPYADQAQDPAEGAGNAQASMLEEFLGGHGAGEQRLIGLSTACAIGRFAAKARAQAHLQVGSADHVASRYDAGTDLSAARWNRWGHLLGTGLKYEPTRLLHLDRPKAHVLLCGLVESLGLFEGTGPCYERLVTVVGETSSGRTETALELCRLLNELAEQTARSPDRIASLVNVPRGSGWSGRPSDEAHRLVSRDLFREIAAAFGVTLSSQDSAEGLRDLLTHPEERHQLPQHPFVLLVNGVDRLGDACRALFVELMSLLPRRIRLVQFTSRFSEAEGHIVRLADVRSESLQEEAINDCLGEAAAHGVWAEEVGGITLRQQILVLAQGHVGLVRLLSRYLLHVRMPRLIGRPMLARSLWLELGAIAPPPCLVPDLPGFARRVARLILAELDEASLSDVFLLSAIPGRQARAVAEHFSPTDYEDLAPSVFNWRDDEGLSVPSTIRSVLSEEPRERWLEEKRAVDRRRLLLFTAELAPKNPSVITRGPDRRWAQEPSQLLRTFLDLDLQAVDLSGGPFEDFVLDQLRGAEHGLGEAIPESTLALLRRLIDPRPEFASSISLELRAKAMCIHARAQHEACGHDQERGSIAVQGMRIAYWATHGESGAAPKHFGFPSRLRRRDIHLLALVTWRLARLFQAGIYVEMLGGRAWVRVMEEDWADPGGPAREEWKALWDGKQAHTGKVGARLHRARGIELLKGAGAKKRRSEAAEHFRAAHELNVALPSAECALRNRIELAWLEGTAADWSSIWSELSEQPALWPWALLLWLRSGSPGPGPTGGTPWGSRDALDHLREAFMRQGKHALAEMVGMLPREEPGRAAARFLIQRIERSIRLRGSCRLGICGGRGADAVLPYIADWLAREPKKKPSLLLTWVDERDVTKVSKESNSGRAFRRWPILRDVEHLVFHGDADAYRKGFGRLFHGGLDVALLGLGEDGHVASVFPGVEPETPCGMSSSDNHPHQRMRLAIDVLAAVPDKALVVIGPGKGTAVEEARWDGSIVSRLGAFRWFIDKDYA